MQNEDLENQIDFLLSAAMRRCGDICDAQDLTQETLLAALAYTAGGNEIGNMRAWLLAVLGRKYNDMLRRKYREATVSIGEGFDLVDEAASAHLEPEDDEAERVRRAVAYTARLYREVLVQHYMEGRTVREIAAGLGIPEGTVKSRLRLGREQVRKGMDSVEKYTKQSYSPITLWLDISGSPSVNSEPYSLVSGDLLAQNILWLAYPRPRTVEDISLALGVPTAYVEPVVRKLVNGELMRRDGGKVYTNFVIFTLEDKERHIPAQKKFVQEHFDLVWGAADACLEALRQRDFYRRLTFDEKNSLELYVAFHCLDYGLFVTFSQAMGEVQRVPDRPNGGRWIAFGQVETEPFDRSAHAELLAHSYSGERIVRNDSYGGDGFEMHVYSPDGFPGDAYYSSPDYTFFPENLEIDPEIAKLLYILHKGIPPEMIGFNTEYLRAIPWLTRCRVLREEAGRPVLNIPVLSREEAKDLWELTVRAHLGMAEALKSPLAAFLKGKGKKLPAHLKGVPLLKQYMYADTAMVLAAIREAISYGRLYDGHYDDTSSGFNQPPCPMVLVI